MTEKKQGIILVRTHDFDQGRIQLEYLRRKYNTPSVMVLHCDTSTQHDLNPQDVIVFTDDDINRLGFGTYNRRDWAWHMGDCAMYVACERLRAYEYFLMTEYDCKINFDVDNFLADFADRNDFCAQYAGFHDPSWAWSKSAQRWFSKVLGSFFPLVGASRRLLHAGMVKRRYLHSEWILHGSIAHKSNDYMVHCEAFLPSLCHELGFQLLDFSHSIERWDTSLFTGFRIIPWDSPRYDHVAALHPCFPSKDLQRYLQSVLANNHVSDSSKNLVREDYKLAIEAGEIYITPVSAAR